MTVLIDTVYRWRTESHGKVRLHFVGDERPVRQVFQRLLAAADHSPLALKELFHDVSGYYAFIVEAPGFLFACADKVRSYPAYYAVQGARVAVSNSARLLRQKFGLNEIDSLSRLEMAMASYVTGRETLYRDLFQLQAGEYFFLDLATCKHHTARYYLYFAEKSRQGREEDFIHELDQVTDRIFRRNIEEVNGAPIWVPLSGGLDSRLIAYKLWELKYDNVVTFSYGPPGNYEAKIAKEVAGKLGLRWLSLPSFRQNIRDYFWSPERRRYWEYADGLHVVPNIHWIDSTKYLMEKRLIPENAVFMNGQSGDFIQGAHIPELKEGETANLQLLLEKIVAKHYSLQKGLMEDAASLKRVHAKITQTLRSLVPLSEGMDHAQLGQYLELWEWQERQCKRVLNGQRTYDYYGFAWKLPLWDEEYMRFWVDVPLQMKLKRYLFVRHFEKIDKVGIFRNYKPVAHRWPAKLFFVLYLGKAVKLLFGSSAAKTFYQYLDYFSMYSTLYAPFTYREYVRNCRNFRSPVSFLGKVYEDEYVNGAL